MNSRLLSFLFAAGLVGCDGPTGDDYRAFVEEDCVVVSSVEAALSFPPADSERKL